MLSAAAIVFWIAFALLSLTWLAYPMVLAGLAMVIGKMPAAPRPGTGTGSERIMLSVLVAAHNEERNIDARIQNILDTAPKDFELEVVIASDGSTDRTLPIAQSWAQRDQRIRAFATQGARGKVAAHNQGVPRTQGAIVVFTDVETEFAAEFLDLIGHAFDDPQVGCASGKMIFKDRAGGVNDGSFSLYWRYEILLRRLETRIGIHALATGACSAVRRHLFKPIAAVADQDFITPLDAVLQGYKTVFVPDAKAYDFVADTLRGEFRDRVRMTAKNFANTFTHWGAVSFVRFPAVSAGLVLHKLFRWLTPYFVLAMLVAGGMAIALGTASPAIWLVTLGSIIGLAYGALGAFVPGLPLAGSIWSFMVANAAFAIGVWRALTGRVPTAFR